MSQPLHVHFVVVLMRVGVWKLVMGPPESYFLFCSHIFFSPSRRVSRFFRHREHQIQKVCFREDTPHHRCPDLVDMLASGIINNSHFCLENIFNFSRLFLDYLTALLGSWLSDEKIHMKSPCGGLGIKQEEKEHHFTSDDMNIST